eukprot:3068132-Rhodomonas_salina.1
MQLILQSHAWYTQYRGTNGTGKATDLAPAFLVQTVRGKQLISPGSCPALPPPPPPPPPASIPALVGPRSQTLDPRP